VPPLIELQAAEPEDSAGPGETGKGKKIRPWRTWIWMMNFWIVKITKTCIKRKDKVGHMADAMG